MKLRQKTLLIVNATLASLIGVLYVASSSILMGSIRTAEENEAQQTIKGVQNLLTQTQENFRDRFADWSAWDDTYRFIRDRNQDYIQANLVPSTLANLKVNAIVFVNQSGRIIYGTGFDQETKTETPIPQALASRLANPRDLLLQRPDLTTKQTGIVMSPSAPILITSQPIVTSDIQGPVRGSLIIGRNLDATQIQRLSEQARLPLKLHQVDDKQLPESLREIGEKLNQQNTIIQALDETNLAVYSIIPDIDGKPALILEVNIPRTTYQQGKASLTYLLIILIVAGICFDAIVVLLLEKSILTRLSKLIECVNHIGYSQDLKLRLAVSGNDEMSALTVHINQMLESIEEADTNQKQTLKKLAQANQEIQFLNKQLESENQRLGSELAVTRQLQEKILPKPKELKSIPNLDIASYMQPASEVGGDYYDILVHEGQVKIGIGDITGHGLESGMLMLMVQTAIRTLLANNISEPGQFLGILNRVIYDNVQRMNTDKNLTITLIDYEDGKLQLSGQHEEVLVVRSDGEIERIDTMDLGFPVGLEPDISSFIDQQNIQLFAGDGIVLYTDGLTEAENQAHQHYGIDRLSKIVRMYWHRCAEEIKNAVIDDLHRFIGKRPLDDDVTLLVIKQQ